MFLNENKRINQLHEERMSIQKKTFTKWINTFLQKVGLFEYVLEDVCSSFVCLSIPIDLEQAKMHVDDIFVDLADGVKLMKLLEIISGEKLGKPTPPRMRVHKIENLNKCLLFLHTKVS